MSLKRATLPNPLTACGCPSIVMRLWLALFSLNTDGGPCSQNRRLLEYIRQQPEFAGFDTVQIMRFLDECFPPPPHRQVWKIAPGESARLWEPLREHGYIGIGWPELGDLSSFRDRVECAEALKKAGDIARRL